MGLGSIRGVYERYRAFLRGVTVGITILSLHMPQAPSGVPAYLLDMCIRKHMGDSFYNSQKAIWTPGKLVKIGGGPEVGLVLGLGPGAVTVSIWFDGNACNVMNPFWDGDVHRAEIPETTLVTSVALLPDDPFYDLFLHACENA